jgi:hypothetical protein
MRHRHHLNKFIEETRASQGNIVFPDVVRNGRSVDAFLWNGRPNPTLVQRIAARMLGVAFMVMGLLWLSNAVKARVEAGFSISVVIEATFALAIVAVGIRIFRNGFPRPSKQADSN